MDDARFREPSVYQPLHPFPVELSPLAASGEHPIPASGYLGPERHECPEVGRDRMVIEVASDDVPQPLPLNWDWLVHALRHSLGDHLELRPHAVASGLPFDLECTRARLPADEGEAQEVEGFRLA